LRESSIRRIAAIIEEVRARWTMWMRTEEVVVVLDVVVD
jgi:hypothetical protein